MKCLDNEHQRINISRLAQKVINQDKVVFSALNNVYSDNGFINEILRIYLDNSCEDYELDHELANAQGTSKEYRISQKTLESLNSFIEILGEDDELNIAYHRTTSFLKSILENYARLPYLQREQLFHKKITEIIEDAIKRKRNLHVTTFKETVDVSPFEIIPSKEGTFSYLIGFDSNEQIHSIRISQIKNIKPFGKMHLPPEYQLVETKEKLAEYGATFIEDPICNIKIRFLTEHAKQSYEYSIIHRPIHNKIIDEEKMIYQFACSLRQAEFFFFRFAGVIDILEPQELKDWFINKYKLGLETLTK
jgi:hypothetical protein